MPSISHVFRLTIALLVVAVAHFASEQLAFGQGVAWAPYRDTDRSEEQAARRVQQKQIRLPPPIRLAQYQSPNLQTIGSGSFDDTNRVLTESIEPPESPSQTVSHPMLQAESMPGFAPGAPAHIVIRSPALQTRSANRVPQALFSNSLASGSRPSPAMSTGSRLDLEQFGGGGTEQAGLFHQSDSQHIPAPPLHGTHSKLAKKRLPLGPIQPRRATIPGARERATWKQPYSYGYFGSKSTRHWGTHHGYRDRYTEYRYR